MEDFKPFRQFNGSRLGKRPELHVVAEASDGLEAVRLAKELQADLILLDVPAQAQPDRLCPQIRTFAPKARIIFLTTESSVDVVQEAGYDVNRDASTYQRLWDAVLAGRQFPQFLIVGTNGDDTRAESPALAALY